MLQVIDVIARLADRVAPGHEVVVTADRMKPGLVQPPQRMVRFRPAIDQVADRKQSVGAGIKPNRIQAALQLGEAAVDVAHGEVPADRVLSKPRHRRGGAIDCPGKIVSAGHASHGLFVAHCRRTAATWRMAHSSAYQLHRRVREPSRT